MALETGAAQGLGAVIAAMMAREGALVLLTDRDEPCARAGTAAIKAEFGEERAFAAGLDVTLSSGWNTAVEVARERLGGLSGLINNAGIAPLGSIESLDEAAWDQAMCINLDSVFHGGRAALPLMRESQPGISSIAGLIASPAFAAYNISRAGVWMLTKSIALHCAREGWDICCNSIHPTFVRTPMLDSLGGDRSREEAEGTLCPPDPDRAPRRTPRRRVCCCLPRFRREPNDGHFRTKAEWQHFRDVMQAVACTARVECAHRGDLTPYRRNCTDAP